jgi:hypothetical protein
LHSLDLLEVEISQDIIERYDFANHDDIWHPTSNIMFLNSCNHFTVVFLQ